MRPEARNYSFNDAESAKSRRDHIEGNERERIGNMSSRLTQIDHSKGSTAIVETDYTLNAVGNRTQKLSTLGAGPSTTENYSYDSIDPRAISDKRGLRQVTGFTRSAGVPPALGGVPASATYSYDAVGNRTNVTGSVPGAGSYSANNLNQYTSAQGKVLLYDGNGNLSQVGLDDDYSYDSKNRLLSATKTDAPGTTNVVFAYDNRNRQVSRTVNGATTYFIFAGSPGPAGVGNDNWSLIAEYDDQGGLLAEYVHGAHTDEILAKIDTSGTVYYHHDGLGSTVALTDDLGDLIESYTYDVFGAVTVFDANNQQLAIRNYGNRFTFTGREYIAELGLYDYRNRMYSPELGRFLQSDPIRFNAGDVNLYRYVGNNSVNWVDSYGLKPGDSYPGRDAAAKDAMRDIYKPSIKNDREYAGEITKHPEGGFTYTEPRGGEKSQAGVDTGCPDYEGYYHSHGAPTPGYDGENFSDQDMDVADKTDKPAYLITPEGRMKKYTPSPGSPRQGETSKIGSVPTATKGGKHPRLR